MFQSDRNKECLVANLNLVSYDIDAPVKCHSINTKILSTLQVNTLHSQLSGPDTTTGKDRAIV